MDTYSVSNITSQFMQHMNYLTSLNEQNNLSLTSNPRKKNIILNEKHIPRYAKDKGLEARYVPYLIKGRRKWQAPKLFKGN